MMTGVPDDYEVIVLYYRLGHALADTIDHLKNQTNPPRSILVVDNKSNDGVALQVTRDFDVNYCVAPRNFGYAGGMNFGFEASRTNSAYVLFITHEVLLEQTCAEHLTDALQHPEIAAVGPVLRLKSRDTVWSTGGVYKPGLATHRTKLSEADESFSECDWLDGAAIMTRRTVFRDLEGFDTAYFMYWEDLDFCLRLRRKLGRVAVANRAQALQDTATAPPYYLGRNSIIFYHKNERARFVMLAAVQSIAKALRHLARGEFSKSRARLLGLQVGIREVVRT